ncbi:MAG TPA: hypothetical protein VJ010_02665 [Actinomycetota bacterium]|nr:hypothetical protein [Actinomycetota bacterium]
MDTTATAGEAPVPAEAPLHARGGISIGGAITGALVFYAAALLFTLATRAVASYAGYRPYLLPIGGTHGAGLAAAAGIVAGLLLAFAWGGYTAGRMGRGRGWLNGLLAGLAVGLIGAAGIGAAALLRPGPGLDLHLHLPAGYPHIHFLVARWILAVSGTGVALLASVLGGALGSRFHTRLERRAVRQEAERLEARTTFADLREAMTEPAPVLGGPAEAIASPGEGLPARS